MLETKTAKFKVRGWKLHKRKTWETENTFKPYFYHKNCQDKIIKLKLCHIPKPNPAHLCSLWSSQKYQANYCITNDDFRGFGNFHAKFMMTIIRRIHDISMSQVGNDDEIHLSNIN